MKIYLDDMLLLFKCNRKRCKDCPHTKDFCNHTSDIEYAVFDGEKAFTDEGYCGGLFEI